jgi:hypothetical protein
MTDEWVTYVCPKGHHRQFQPLSGAFSAKWLIGKRCPECNAKRDWTRLDVAPHPGPKKVVDK